jgi:hypothetical protein
MDRPLFANTIDQLETLVRDKPYDRFQLSRVREELTYRDTDRAHQLLREVEGLLSGLVPSPPRPPRPDDPSDQGTLL